MELNDLRLQFFNKYIVDFQIKRSYLIQKNHKVFYKNVEITNVRKCKQTQCKHFITL